MSAAGIAVYYLEMYEARAIELETAKQATSYAAVFTLGGVLFSGVFGAGDEHPAKIFLVALTMMFTWWSYNLSLAAKRMREYHKNPLPPDAPNHSHEHREYCRRKSAWRYIVSN